MENPELTDVTQPEQTTGPKVITEDNVTQLFEARTALWTAKSDDEIRAVVQKYNIPVPYDMTTFDTKARKKLFAIFFEANYPQSKDIVEHTAKLNESLNTTVKKLTLDQSKATLWVFGSYANGKVNGTHSDLDYIMILPKITDPAERKAELEKIKNLTQVGYVFSEKLGPFEHLDTIMAQGHGLTRLYSMTQAGLESEFHVIGAEDLESIDKLWPGKIDRVNPTDPKMEVRPSFTGELKAIPKPGDTVPNYFITDDGVFKGFFPENIATGEIVYDPTDIGTEKRQDAWLAIVKGYLYHNDAYKKDDVGTFHIDTTNLSFEGFLKTLYYQKPTDYVPDKLARLEREYYNALGKLSHKYGMEINDSDKS